MLCAFCSAIKPWTSQNFPVYYYAKCVDCYSKDETPSPMHFLSSAYKSLVYWAWTRWTAPKEVLTYELDERRGTGDRGSGERAERRGGLRHLHRPEPDHPDQGTRPGDDVRIDGRPDTPDTQAGLSPYRTSPLRTFGVSFRCRLRCPSPYDKITYGTMVTAFDEQDAEQRVRKSLEDQGWDILECSDVHLV